MVFLSSIFEELGIRKNKEEADAKAAQTVASIKPATPPLKIPVAAPKSNVSSPDIAPAPPATSLAAGPAKPAPMEMVDVVSILDKMSAGNNLNWKTSIVDLLKDLGIDISLTTRKELAAELGCPKDRIKPDYSQMNIWLHNKVLQEIAANGGNVPQNLLD